MRGRGEIPGFFRAIIIAFVCVCALVCRHRGADNRENPEGHGRDFVVRWTREVETGRCPEKGEVKEEERRETKE